MNSCTCPKCGTDIDVPESEGSQRIACPECGQRLVVGAPKPARKGPPASSSGIKAKAGPPPRSTPKAKPRPRDDEDDDRAPRPGKAKGRPSPPPRAAAKARRPRDDEDDYDDEDDDRRGRRKGKEQEKGSSALLWILIGGGAGLVVLVAVPVLGLYLYLNGQEKADHFATVTPPRAGQGQGAPPFAGGPLQGGGPGGAAPAGGGAGGAPTAPTTPATTKPTEPPPEEPVALSHGADGQKIYRYLLKSTALILIVVPGPNGELRIGMGSGALVDTTNRLVLTNFHVAGKSNQVFVFFPTYRDGKMITERDYFFKQAEKKDALVGKVVYKNQPVDLAVLQLDRLPSGLHALPLASTRPAPGSPVFSVGHPGRSGGLWVYTEGKVRQGLHKQWRAGDRDGHEILDFEAQVLLTDSPTNPGDSGGPLVNGRGELVAIVHGADPNSNLMSLFIDGSEARKVLDDYAKASGTKLALETSSPLGAEIDSANVPDLMRALESKDAVARANAARSLGDLGATGKVAVAGLLKALNDPDDVVRKLALEALTKIGTPDRGDVPALVSALKGSNAGARAYVAGVLGKLGPEGRAATRPLLELLKDKDPAVRQSAARAVGKVGGDSKDLVRAALREALNDEDADVRAAAAQGLAALPVTAADVPDVVALLKHADAGVRAQAAVALGGLGRDGRAAVKPLGEALQDQSAGVRQAALKSLARIGPDARDLMPRVQEALRDSDGDVRRAALETLGSFGPEAKPAARDIADALKDAEVRKSALAALVKIGPPAAPEAVSPVANLLGETDREDRLLAVDALVALKPSASQLREVVPKLIALFEGADKAERDKVAEALGKFGAAAVPGLTAALGDPSKAVRLGAATALGDIGPAARRGAGQVLTAHAQADADAEVRQACQKALSKMQR